MSAIVVLTALDLEARTLARDLGLARVAATPWPHFRRGALEVASVGLGARHLDERVAACAPPRLLLSAGACGALSPALAAGALVVPEVVLTAAGARHVTAAVPPLARAGTLLGVAAVVGSPPAKARLWMETGALAVDMESGPIAAWAAARGVPMAVVRAVSDPASRAVPPDLADAVAADGRLRPMRAVGAVLARPGAVADAIALRAATTTALRAVGAALARVARSG